MSVYKTYKMQSNEELREWEDRTYTMIEWRNFIKELQYWRKFNALHAWFVDNVQGGEDDCLSYLITKEDLEKLRETLSQIEETPGDAEDLLPTRSGFFFGGTEYDEYYHNEVRRTLVWLEKLIESFDFENYSIYYRASW